MIEKNARHEHTSIKEVDPQTVTIQAIRHGPTAWNIEKRIQGNIDNPLLQDGITAYFDRLHAADLNQPDRIIVTQLKRTGETAERLMEYMNWSAIPMVTKTELHERKWGIFEGKTHAEVLEILLRDPEMVRSYPNLAQMTDLSPIIDEPDFKVPGAESMNEVRARVTPALLSLREEFPGESLLFVGHAGTLISQGMDHRIITTFQVGYVNGKPQMQIEA